MSVTAVSMDGQPEAAPVMMKKFDLLEVKQKDSFDRDGFLHVEDLLTNEEIELLRDSFRLLLNKGKLGLLGKDFSDINSEFGKKESEMSGISIMIPRLYDQRLLKGLELMDKKLEYIVNKLFGDNMLYAFDRFIAKKPMKKDAIFHWHQDIKYCMAHGEHEQLSNVKDKRVAILSIALDNTNENNGCIKYIRGSHKEKELRKHYLVKENVINEDNLLMDISQTQVNEDEEDIVSMEIKTGDLTVHGERTVHGSMGNKSDNWRRSYVIQFRSKEYIEKRNELGLTRSFNKNNE